MKRKIKEMLGDYCPLDRCPWRNNSAGHCLWPGDWCPREGDIEQFRRQRSAQRWRDMRGR